MNEEDTPEGYRQELIGSIYNGGSAAQEYGTDTVSYHELVDRVSLLQDNWERWIIEHPACIFDEAVFYETYRINEAMIALYQAIAIKPRIRSFP